MPDKRSVDPATNEMLEIADARDISTVFSRAEAVKPCPIGAKGACCKICTMGPCRLVGKTTRGVCGATLGTIAARNYARQVAAGTSAHSDHGRDLAFTLIAIAEGKAQGYRVRDEAKLREVASFMDIPIEDRSVDEIALDVGQKALEQFGQQRGEIIYVSRATEKRQQRCEHPTPPDRDRQLSEVRDR